MMPAKRSVVVEDGSPAVDADAPALAVEAHEQEADIRVLRDVADRAVHRIAVILGILDHVRSGDPDKAGIAGADAAIDVVLPRGCDEEGEETGTGQNYEGQCDQIDKDRE